jgi:hypothetical protein
MQSSSLQLGIPFCVKSMKSPLFKYLTWIGLCIATGLISVGCNETGASRKLPPRVAPLTRLDWNLKTLVEAYQVAGHTNSKWDEPATRALTEFARFRSPGTTSNNNSFLIISTNCVAAVDAGCDDPMIRYLYVRYGMDPNAKKQAFLDAFCNAAVAMEQSSYPGIRKFYAWQRAGDQINFTYDSVSNIPPEISRLEIWPQAGTNLQYALFDRTIPPEEAYDACHEYLGVFKYSKEYYPSLYHMLEAKFHDDWTNVPIILLLKGEAYTDMAWQGRGSGYANTITQEGWKIFAERLAVAEQALTNAWRLNKKDPRIAVQMMKVELGQGQGRDRMELWFNRAMALDSNDYDACNAKLWYLEPKWYGSVADMLDFGRECASNKKWGGHIPLILRDAHVEIQKQFVSASEKADYWKRPEVWLDLKNAFDRFFELNPNEIGWYHDYVWYANEAGQWSDLNQLIPKLGPLNYDFFGGKEKFEKMVALAREHAGDPK